MTIALVSILAAIVLFVIYLLFSRENKKANDKFAPRGKIEEYFSDEKERRRCKRFDVELEVRYNRIGIQKSSLSTKSKNISKIGIAILVYEILPKDSFIEMEMSIPGEKQAIKLKGRVAWCEDRGGAENLDKDGKRAFTAGIEFTDIDKKHQDILIDYINKHLSKE